MFIIFSHSTQVQVSQTIAVWNFSGM
jgi:hypothetical protein